MRLFLLSTIAIGCGGKLEPDTFVEERAVAYCEVLQECGDLSQMGMDAYDCQLSQEQGYDGCSGEDFDVEAAETCLEEIPSMSCDETNAPLESTILICAEVCP